MDDPPQGAERPRGFPCPQCTAANPPDNLHCEHCGALLRPRSDALAAAPLSSRRTLAGFAVLLVVVLGLWLLLRNGDAASPEAEPAPATTAAGAAPTTAPPVTVPLTPAAVSASSEYDGLEAGHLIDGNLESYWNDASLHGDGAVLEFTFDGTPTLTGIEFVNVENEERFHRNFRIAAYEISFGALADPVVGSLEDAPGAQLVTLPAVATPQVTVRVTGTHQAETYQGSPPFEELALAEVRFLGAPP